MSVKSEPDILMLSPHLAEYTQEINHSNVMFVRCVSLMLAFLKGTRDETQTRKHKLVISVKCISDILVLSPDIPECTQESNQCDFMSVRSVTQASHLNQDSQGQGEKPF